jgi:hypothetical protein
MIIGINGKIGSGKDTVGRIIQFLTWVGRPKHISETALDKHQFKYEINNNGTMEELVWMVKEILIKEKIISNSR